MFGEFDFLDTQINRIKSSYVIPFSLTEHFDQKVSGSSQTNHLRINKHDSIRAVEHASDFVFLLFAAYIFLVE